MSVAASPALRVFAASLLLGLALPSPAQAGDGTVEINHACATRTGCFPGDTVGYPVTIDGSAGRSYRLTSDLGGSPFGPNANTSAIVILAPHVSLDLAGFQVARDQCVNATAPCRPASGVGVGILGTAEGISVSNGSVLGMGDDGIRLAARARVHRIHAWWNGGDGIEVGAESIVSGSTSRENGEDGFDTTGGGVRLESNLASSNSGSGVSTRTSDGLVTVANVVDGNGEDGMSLSATAHAARVEASLISNNVEAGITGGRCVATENVFSGNQIGIFIGFHSIASKNAASSNGFGIKVTRESLLTQNVANNNAGRGLEVQERSRAERNLAIGNSETGLFIFDTLNGPRSATYRANTMFQNSFSDVNSGGIDMGANSCGGTTSC